MLNFNFFFFFKADFAPDELEVGVREHILLDLEAFVRRQFSGELEPIFVASQHVFQDKESMTLLHVSPGKH